jgi:hypothetical protein
VIRDREPAERGQPTAPQVRTPFQRSLWSLMAVVAIAALILALIVWLRDVDPAIFVFAAFCAVFFSPGYLPLILMFVPTAAARRLFRGVRLAAILVAIPSCIGGATDGFAYQFISVFVFYGSWWLVLAFGFGYLASRARFRRLAR